MGSQAIVRAVTAWIALSAVGVAIVALPDGGPRVFTISDTHGPSPIDLLGVALLLLGWVIFLAVLWRERRSIRPRPLPVAVALAGGGGVVAWSVLTDNGAWWVLGAAVLVGVQLWLALLAAKTRASADE